jgi:hypothetical protein
MKMSDNLTVNHKPRTSRGSLIAHLLVSSKSSWETFCTR